LEFKVGDCACVDRGRNNERETKERQQYSPNSREQKIIDGRRLQRC